MAMVVSRIASSGVTGVATGLLGGVVPIIGFTAAIIVQLVEKGNPTLQRYEHITEGVLDGSTALLCRVIIRAVPVAGPAAIAISPIPARALRRAESDRIGQADELFSDADALIG